MFLWLPRPIVSNYQILFYSHFGPHNLSEAVVLKYIAKCTQPAESETYCVRVKYDQFCNYPGLLLRHFPSWPIRVNNTIRGQQDKETGWQACCESFVQSIYPQNVDHYIFYRARFILGFLQILCHLIRHIVRNLLKVFNLSQNALDISSSHLELGSLLRRTISTKTPQQCILVPI